MLKRLELGAHDPDGFFGSFVGLMAFTVVPHGFGKTARLGLLSFAEPRPDVSERLGVFASHFPRWFSQSEHL